jgi:hypothetical protein
VVQHRRVRPAGPFTFGSAGRHSVLAPGLANVDLSIVKGWHFGE